MFKRIALLLFVVGGASLACGGAVQRLPVDAGDTGAAGTMVATAGRGGVAGTMVATAGRGGVAGTMVATAGAGGVAGTMVATAGRGGVAGTMVATAGAGGVQGDVGGSTAGASGANAAGAGGGAGTGGAAAGTGGSSAGGGGTGDPSPVDAGPDAPCSAGAVCVLANAPCRAGRVSCDTGTAVCVATAGDAPNGTQCGVNLFCMNGACATDITGASCQPTARCHRGVTTLVTGSITCQDTGTFLADGTLCGTNQICMSGNCVGALDLPVDAGADAGACPPGASNGSLCGIDQVCHDGLCVPCRAGAICAVAGKPCRTGSTACGTGVAICAETANVANGTSCGGNMVCTSGTCITCTVGLACTPVNPCHAGTQVCSPAITCQDTGTALPDGTACGTNKVCQSGSCVTLQPLLLR